MRSRADLLTACLQLRAKRSRAPFSFASCYALTLCLAALRLLLLRRTLFESCQKQTTRPRLLAVVSVAMQKLPPTPLHVRGGDIALLTQSIASLETNLALNLIKSKFMFSRHGSRRVKFKAEIYKFDFKFDHKKIRRSIVR